MLNAQQTFTLNEKLRLAASKGQTNKVLELLEAGAKFDVDHEGKNVLHLAAQYGHADTVAAALLASCDPNTPTYTGHSALQFAAAEGHVDIAKQLIKYGARIDRQDEVHGNTASHEAAWKGYSQTLEVLCKAKANLYIKNKGGFAPLHLACQNGHNQSCRVLLLSGCKPDLKNNYGDTPLHTAARYGHAGVMRILISAQSKVSEQNKNADTALHIAVAMGRRKLTKMLLEAKCDQFIRNKQGETALDIARRKHFTEVQDILLHPPSHRIPVQHSGNKKSVKKREKDSGTSSKDSESRHKNKQKKTKHKVHFPDKKEVKQSKWSPYGCHYYPDMIGFPKPKLDSLPSEPLKKGEQYYLDLAGNIHKGAIGVGYTCYCAPFFKHVEEKLEYDKQELIQHIDLARADLQARMANLERRTKGRLLNLNQTMLQKFANEQAEYREHSEHLVLKQQLAMERQQEQSLNNVTSELKTWVQNRMSEFEEKHYCQHNPKDFMYRSFSFHNRHQNNSSLQRSKSEELLSENTHLSGSNFRSASPLCSRNDRYLEIQEGETIKNTGAKSKWPNGYNSSYSVNALYNKTKGSNYISKSQSVTPTSRGSKEFLQTEFVKDHKDLDYNLHVLSGKEDTPSPVLPHPDECETNLEPEFKITGQFFDTVTNEMEKWYERRLINLEKNAAQKITGNCDAFEGRIQAIEEQLTKLNESFSVSGGSRSGSSLV